MIDDVDADRNEHENKEDSDPEKETNKRIKTTNWKNKRKKNRRNTVKKRTMFHTIVLPPLHGSYLETRFFLLRA